MRTEVGIRESRPQTGIIPGSLLRGGIRREEGKGYGRERTPGASGRVDHFSCSRSINSTFAFPRCNRRNHDRASNDSDVPLGPPFQSFPESVVSVALPRLRLTPSSCDRIDPDYPWSVRSVPWTP